MDTPTPQVTLSCPVCSGELLPHRGLLVCEHTMDIKLEGRCRYTVQAATLPTMTIRLEFNHSIV